MLAVQACAVRRFAPPSPTRADPPRRVSPRRVFASTSTDVAAAVPANVPMTAEPRLDFRPPQMRLLGQRATRDRGERCHVRRPYIVVDGYADELLRHTPSTLRRGVAIVIYSVT